MRWTRPDAPAPNWGPRPRSTGRHRLATAAGDVIESNDLAALRREVREANATEARRLDPDEGARR